MTVEDLKYELKKAIDEVPESVLIDILDYLKQVKVASEGKFYGKIKSYCNGWHYDC